jgi:hypothetical protein
MRKIVVVATAGATMLSAVAPAPGLAQNLASQSGTASTTTDFSKINPVVVATFKAFPTGGQALTERIRGLILQNNDLAADVARYLRSSAILGAAQREAAEKGLAEALSRLGILAQDATPTSTGPSTEFLAVITGLAAIGGLAGYVAKQNKTTVSPN